jgi:hypothetical protein
VQNVGNALAVGDEKRGLIYHISGHTIIGKTKLDGTCLVRQFYIDGGVVIAPNSCKSKGNVLIYNYPSGGAPIETLSGFTAPYAAVVSR